MSDITDRLRARYEQIRAQGRHATHFMVEDIEWLIAENERLESDNVDLVARIDEVMEIEDPLVPLRTMTRDEAEAYIGE